MCIVVPIWSSFTVSTKSGRFPYSIHLLAYLPLLLPRPREIPCDLEAVDILIVLIVQVDRVLPPGRIRARALVLDGVDVKGVGVDPLVLAFLLPGWDMQHAQVFALFTQANTPESSCWLSLETTLLTRATSVRSPRPKRMDLLCLVGSSIRSQF